MPLVPIPLPDETTLRARPLPPDVEALVADGEACIRAFVEQDAERAWYPFVPSDFRAVYRALAWITERRLAPGSSFLEWGSGFGVVTLLAARLGWHAAGIEIEADLVEQARRLGSAHEASAEFVTGSFLPEDTDVEVDSGEDLVWLAEGGAAAYGALEADVDDFDLVFGYPWPGEAGTFHALFEAHAARGALLLTFEGSEGLSLHRLA